MNDMERRKFEDSFKDAFQEAEVSPSESVWTAIELDLERAEGGKMKRRILFYKMLAAASVVFGMSVAGVGYYMMQSETSVSNGQLAKVNSLPAAQTVPEREPEGAATTLEINDLTVTNSVESKIIADNSNSKSSERESGSSANNFSAAFNSQAGSASGSDQDLAGTNSGSEPAPSEVRTAEVNSVPDQDDGLRSARVIDQTSMASIHSNGASNTSVKK